MKQRMKDLEYKEALKKMATQQIEFLHDGCISAAINNWYFMTILFLAI